jgi:trimeric autotransporter adhesin
MTGDNLTVASGFGAFADKNAGTGKTVTISGLALGGADAGNYTLAGITAGASADITRVVITSIAGITAPGKTYDGSTSAVIDLSGAVFTGMIAGDHLTVASGTAAFADRNAGTGKTVLVTGLTLGGADAGNYTLASPTAATTADIARAVITSIAGITAAGKTYDGSAAAVVDLSGAVFSGLLAGDTLSVSGTGTFADRNAGAGKTVTVTGLTLGGADAGNYRLAGTTVTTTADISQAVISSISGIVARDKIFDGTATAPLDLSGASFNGMVAGDRLGVASALGLFDSAAPGHAKPVRITGLVLGGADAGNYRLADTTASTIADIAISSSAPLYPDQADRTATPGFDAPTSVLLDPGPPLIEDLRFLRRSVRGH